MTPTSKLKPAAPHLEMKRFRRYTGFIAAHNVRARQGVKF